MRQLRPAHARFHSKFDWLDSWHTFSFADHYDPEHMGFRSLRVINDDRIAAGAGFPFHPHADMEILSVMAEGALAHKDSQGNGSTIRPDQVQLMSAGRGIRHSEFNPSDAEPARLLQIWIMPDKRGYEPNYQEAVVEPTKIRNRFGELVTPDGANGSLSIRQDARVLRGQFEGGTTAEVTLDPKRYYWLQMIAGNAVADGQDLSEGDGLAIAEETALHLNVATGADMLLFDLA